jgi:hydrogenase-4 membrane subunit HyfE
MSSLLDQSALVLSYLLIVIALGISAARTLTIMVWLYQTQALVLTGVVLMTAFELGRTVVPLGLVAILPFTLAVIVPPLLARVTPDVAVLQPAEHQVGAWLRHLAAGQRRTLKEARLVWLRYGQSRLPMTKSAAIDIFLIATALLAAYRLYGPHAALVVAGLAASIALLLQGMFTMINKKDIVSQIIGLLVVDHGLFLAAVRVAPRALAGFFVISLFLYVLVTLIILLWVLPGLRRTSSFDVAGNRLLKG